jgi:hypothetical protein
MQLRDERQELSQEVVLQIFFLPCREQCHVNEVVVEFRS